MNASDCPGKGECHPSRHEGSFCPKGRLVERVAYVLLFLSVLLLFFTNPGKSLAESANPLLSTKESESDSETLRVISLTLYTSGDSALPTMIYLPSVLLKKIGMEQSEGWDYEVRTINAPFYPSKKEGARAIVTKIELVALPKARKTNLVILDVRNRIFLVHLIPHPKMIGKTPFYSRDVTWWPPYGSFPSEGLRPLDKGKRE